MDNFALLTLVFISVFDRAGIPVAFISGMILLGENSNNLLSFYLLVCAAGLSGDILMYILINFCVCVCFLFVYVDIIVFRLFFKFSCMFLLVIFLFLFIKLFFLY